MIQNVLPPKVLTKITMINGLKLLKLVNALLLYNLIIKFRLLEPKKANLQLSLVHLLKKNSKRFPRKLGALFHLLLIFRTKYKMFTNNK